MCFEEIACPSCASRHVVKNGTTRNRKQKHLCRQCRRQFIRHYSYQGCRPEIRSLIVPMTLNGSGVRDITRVLKICINTVLKVIREQASLTPEPELPARVADVEIDEMWSFVEKKKRQSWLWYARPGKSLVTSEVGAQIPLASNCWISWRSARSRAFTPTAGSLMKS